MNDSKEISFVRLNILENWRFWNQYRIKRDYEAAGREVIAQADALLTQDMESNERAAMLLNEGLEFRKKKQTAGKAGGEAKARNIADDRKAPPSQGRTRPKPKPPTTEDLYDFAFQENLDPTFAREWYEMTVVDRSFRDKNGEPVKDWKKMCKGYVIAKTKKSEHHTENENG